MPLARIITSSAKYSNGLADDLRSRGFQVLTSAPGDSIAESADLEITLNECPPEEAGAAASDSRVTKDMRVFVTPQAFAGNIRSIEMFVLTPKPPSIPKFETEEQVEPLGDGTRSSAGKVLEFATPAEPVSGDLGTLVEATPADTIESVTIAAVEIPSANAEQSVQPVSESDVKIQNEAGTAHSDLHSVIGRALLASNQARVPMWPDMAEMKLVPADLAPAPASFKPQIAPFPAVRAPERIPVASSVHVAAGRGKRFWKIPIIAGIAAALALSAIWMANRLSTSPSRAEASTSTPVAHQSNPEPPEAAQSSTQITPGKQPEKLAPVLAAKNVSTTRARVQRRKHLSDSDYVAKDTTIYFNNRPTNAAGQKSQARP
jgi:hypothetical protein